MRAIQALKDLISKNNKTDNKEERRRSPGRRKEDYVKVTDLEQEIKMITRNKILTYDTMVANFYAQKKNLRQEFVVEGIEYARKMIEQMKNIFVNIFVGLSTDGYLDIAGSKLTIDELYDSIDYKFFTSLIDVHFLIVLNYLSDDIRKEDFLSVQNVSEFLNMKWSDFNVLNEKFFRDFKLYTEIVTREKMIVAFELKKNDLMDMINKFYLSCIEKTNIQKIKMDKVKEQYKLVREEIGLDTFTPILFD